MEEAKAAEKRHVIHDGQKIKNLLADTKKSKQLTQEKLTEGLSFGKSKGLFKRIVDEEAALSVPDLRYVAKRLGVQIRDLVKTPENKDCFPYVEIVDFESEEEVQRKMIELEREYGGRTIVLNSFPSMIYLHGDSDVRKERYDLLMSMRNQEIYPLRSILAFGFFDFDYSLDERIKALDKVISSHNEDSHRDNTISVIQDRDDFIYSRFAGNCEILRQHGGDGMLVINVPFYAHGLLIVRSINWAEMFKKAITQKKSMDKLMDEKATLQMLKIMQDCLKEKPDLDYFVNKLDDLDSPFFEPVRKLASKHLPPPADRNQDKPED